MADRDADIHSIPVTRSLDYAIATPEPGVDSKHLVIGLHGWGQSCRSFARRLMPLTEFGHTIAVPQAPHQFYVSLDPKKVGFSWLTIYERDRSVREFVADIGVMIEDVRNRVGFPIDRIAIVGFSQGVSMAHRLAVAGTIPISAVAACAADLPPDVEEQLPAPFRYPVLIVHAHDDGMIPWEKGEAAKAGLEKAGHPVAVHRYEGGHTLPADVVRHIGGWFNKVAD